MAYQYSGQPYQIEPTLLEVQQLACQGGHIARVNCGPRGYLARHVATTLSFQWKGGNRAVSQVYHLAQICEGLARDKIGLRKIHSQPQLSQQMEKVL